MKILTESKIQKAMRGTMGIPAGHRPCYISKVLQKIMRAWNRLWAHLLRFETSMESMSMTVMSVMADRARSFKSSHPRPPAPMTRTFMSSSNSSAIFGTLFRSSLLSSSRGCARDRIAADGGKTKHEGGAR